MSKITLFFLCFFPFVLTSQWIDSFDSNLNDWNGDVQNFTINGDQMLQLNDNDAGSSSIYRSVDIDSDSISIQWSQIMDFAPSANNFSTIYFHIDNVDLSVANGYALRIGENGSDDAISFIYLNNGVEEVFASGIMGAVADDPAQLMIELNIFTDGLWDIRTDYAGSGVPVSEFQLMEDRYNIREPGFFMIAAEYSASRADLFFYDDISVARFLPDTDAPNIVTLDPSLPNRLLVSFDEFINETGASVSNYTLDNGIGNPINIQDLGDQLSYELTFDQDFDLALEYILTINGVEDLAGNAVQNISRSFFIAKSPERGELLVNEILFDPFVGGEDFIEVYNNSAFSLDLEGVEIANFDRSESTMIIGDVILSPNSYLAFGENIDFLIQQYKPEDINTIIENELPLFNNDSGSVSLLSQDGVVLDSFFYVEDLHFSLIDDTEGVSLERVSFDIDGSDQSNWQSASENVRFATPGYQNSNFINFGSTNDLFELQSQVFSPNQDGDNDVMILNYSLDKPGFVANIKIFDAAGFEIGQIANNELLGTKGFLFWDGLNNDGQISDLGMYIVAGEVFHPDGDVVNVKIVTVLADFID